MAKEKPNIATLELTAGDSEQLDDFARKYTPALTRYFRKRAPQSSDVDDLIQEVFARLARRSDSETSGKSAPDVSGVFEPTTALELLLADASLDYRINELDTVLVGEVATNGSETPGKSQPASSQVLMAQNQTPATNQQPTRPSHEPTQIDNSAAGVILDEIVVTGTNLRGTKNSSSPVFVFDKQEIAKTGCHGIDVRASARDPFGESDGAKGRARFGRSSVGIHGIAPGLMLMTGRTQPN